MPTRKRAVRRPKRWRRPDAKHIAELIEQVADGVARGDWSFGLQMPLTAAERALIDLQHLDGLKLLNRVGILLLTKNGRAEVRYDFVRRTVASMAPLDPVEDANALRALARELRGEPVESE
jgi:hypothetical protein